MGSSVKDTSHARIAFSVLEAFMIYASLFLIRRHHTRPRLPDHWNCIQIFRLLRLWELISQASSVRTIHVAISRSIRDLSSFFLIILVFIFVFALLGNSLFKGRFPADFRPRYDTLWMSCLVQFRCLPRLELQF